MHIIYELFEVSRCPATLHYAFHCSHTNCHRKLDLKGKTRSPHIKILDV